MSPDLVAMLLLAIVGIRLIVAIGNIIAIVISVARHERSERAR